MKNLTQTLVLSFLLCLVLAPATIAEEAGPAPEVLPTAVVDSAANDLASSGDTAPTELPFRPDPVFLAGSDSGGAGGTDTGLVNGGSGNAPRTRIMYEDHFCCPYGASSCYCSYFPGRFCDPIGCPNRTQPNCY